MKAGATTQPVHSTLLPSKGKYTIQIASFKTKTSLLNEVTLLKSKGLNPLGLKNGQFIVVCIGNFTTKEEALSFLSNLKKDTHFESALIRRL